jgi:hypothetical protein
MAERIGLVGFVNTEEIIADTIKRQTPDVVIDGYEVLPNEAFGRIVDNRYPLYGINESGFGFHHLDRLEQIKHFGYAAVSLGPIPAAFIAGETMDSLDYDYIGPRRNEIGLELDKTKITDIFPENSGILPITRVLTSPTLKEIRGMQDAISGGIVWKFVGEYPKYYQDSETRRVRLPGEFESEAELLEFVTNSITESGTVVAQQFIDGQQFSFTCLVDGAGGIFSLGENICYKNRYDGDTGPLCDGTGAAAVNNTLPGTITQEDIKKITDNIVEPYVEFVGQTFGRMPKTFLNLDLIKSDDGIVRLLEVNHREPGGHTMANLLLGLETPLAEILQATNEKRLAELSPRYKQGASIVVSAYPNNFPYPFESDDARPTITIPKLKQGDDVRVYTGWVDVIDESDDAVTVKPQLSPTLLVANHAIDIQTARRNVYSRLADIVPYGFSYRTDIGKQV